jgi:hypothetical protein
VEQHHIGKKRVSFDLFQGHLVGKRSLVANINPIPDGSIRRTARVIGFAFRIQGGTIRVASPHDHRSTDNSGTGNTAMIKKHTISRLYFVPQEISGLVVANSIPRFGTFRSLFQIAERETGRFGLEKPESPGRCHDNL